MANNTTDPSSKCLSAAWTLSKQLDKPVLSDYWDDSISKQAFVGVREENDEKILVKSEDEYTSPAVKFYGCDNAYIVVTENSIYLVSNTIERRKIT